MNLDNLEALTTVLLVGSLLMERLVTIIKTLAPSVFGNPGPDPESIYRHDSQGPFVTKESEGGVLKWPHYKRRRIRVLGLVTASSILAACLISLVQSASVCGGWWFFCGGVSYASDQQIHWLLFAILISGGSAFWNQMVGLASALKDLQVAQREDRRPQIIVVDERNPRFQ